MIVYISKWKSTFSGKNGGTFYWTKKKKRPNLAIVLIESISTYYLKEMSSTQGRTHMNFSLVKLHINCGNPDINRDRRTSEESYE